MGLEMIRRVAISSKLKTTLSVNASPVEMEWFFFKIFGWYYFNKKKSANFWWIYLKKNN